MTTKPIRPTKHSFAQVTREAHDVGLAIHVGVRKKGRYTLVHEKDGSYYDSADNLTEALAAINLKGTRDRATKPHFTEVAQSLPHTSIEAQVFIDGGAPALVEYRNEMASAKTRTVYQVYEEDDAVHQDRNTLATYWTEAEAEQAVKDAEDEALAEGEAVHGREDEWKDQDRDEADWTKCYAWEHAAIPWPPPEVTALQGALAKLLWILEGWYNPVDSEAKAALAQARAVAKGITPAPAPELTALRCSLTEVLEHIDGWYDPTTVDPDALAAFARAKALLEPGR